MSGPRQTLIFIGTLIRTLVQPIGPPPAPGEAPPSPPTGGDGGAEVIPRIKPREIGTRAAKPVIDVEASEVR